MEDGDDNEMKVSAPVPNGPWIFYVIARSAITETRFRFERYRRRFFSVDENHGPKPVNQAKVTLNSDSSTVQLNDNLKQNPKHVIYLMTQISCFVGLHSLLRVHCEFCNG